MVEELLVEGTTKENRGMPSERITHFGLRAAGGFRFKLSFVDVFNLIDMNKFRFFVWNGGYKAFLMAVTTGGKKRIFAFVDSFKGNYLLALPECTEDLIIREGSDL